MAHQIGDHRRRASFGQGQIGGVGPVGIGMPPHLDPHVRTPLDDVIKIVEERVAGRIQGGTARPEKDVASGGQNLEPAKAGCGVEIAPEVGPLELAEQQLWESVLASRDPVQVILYMRAYLDTANTEAARALLVALMALEVAKRGYVLQTGVVKLSDSASALLNNEEVRKLYLGEH